MKQRTVPASLLSQRGRLDSKYYLAPGVAARDRIEEARRRGVDVRPIGIDKDGVGHVWQPSRFRRAYSAPGEESMPYLRPYDALEYLPISAERLSVGRTKHIRKYRISSGTILQTCSGRNLGPLAMVDQYLEQFLLSHDMIRIAVDDEMLRAYLYVYLSTPTGQAVLRQNMSGSMVDHLTTDDVSALKLPLLSDSSRSEIAKLGARSVRLVESARLALQAVLRGVNRAYMPPERSQAQSSGWSMSSSGLSNGGRLDAHYCDPHLDTLRDHLRTLGGVRCSEVADAVLPPRYKRYYVEPNHGRPILSGRQLLQIEPVNLRYISDRSFNDPDLMVLSEGMVAFGAVGRWEGRLGQPALITSSRDGWLASNDVMRLRPHRDSIRPGSLWLAMSCEYVQLQVAALPYGSVVDHLGPEDVEDEVVLPPIDDALGARVEQAWATFDEASALKREAVEAIEDAFSTA